MNQQDKRPKARARKFVADGMEFLDVPTNTETCGTCGHTTTYIRLPDVGPDCWTLVYPGGRHECAQE
jgi:hypothetical protein